MDPRASAATSLNTVARHHGSMPWASPAMRDLETDIAGAIRFHLNVMLTGEGGVGKMSIAQRIHRQSRHGKAPFIVARLPQALEDDTLDRAIADAVPNGTVVIKEAGRMSAPMQARLLRFIEHRTAGGRELGQPSYGTDVRFIAVTSGDLYKLVRFQDFGESLFYRLNRMHLVIPPLRERPEDIPLLLRHFLSMYASGATVPHLSTAARQRLVSYAWPGNVGELRAVAEALASRNLTRSIEPEDLPPDIGGR
jgi:two-component system response regulator AtoC